MNVKDYLQKLYPYKRVTFIITKAVKDDHSPFYHAEYKTTPLQTSIDWLKHNNEPILESIILNDKQPPITWLSGVDWNVDIKNGFAMCILIVNPSDFALMYKSDEQRKHIEKFIERKLDQFIEVAEG